MVMRVAILGGEGGGENDYALMRIMNDRNELSRGFIVTVLEDR